MEFVKLNNGVEMPIVGYGVFQIEDAALCERCVRDALEVGYRLIDTAQAYYNEEAVGRGLRTSGVPREEVFLTTKVWVTEFGYERARASVLESMRKLQVEYLDLVLIHQCLADYYGAYRALEDLYAEGKIRAIGVSNFSAERMADIATFSRVVPAVNQVETHLFWQQAELHEWMLRYGVQHEAWGPLAQHRVSEVAGHPVLREIAAAHGKTSTQVALRALVQRGIVVIPKTVSKERMAENIDLFDFRLTEEEMARIESVDEGKSLWCAYDDPMIVEYAML
ncbi:MAG: aldo/keto reductase [Eggerthellaceae bacterium]